MPIPTYSLRLLRTCKCPHRGRYQCTPLHLPDNMSTRHLLSLHPSLEPTTSLQVSPASSPQDPTPLLSRDTLRVRVYSTPNHLGPNYQCHYHIMIVGAPPMETPPLPSPDLADFYVPEPVKAFLPYFHRQVLAKVSCRGQSSFHNNNGPLSSITNYVVTGIK